MGVLSKIGNFIKQHSILLKMALSGPDISYYNAEDDLAFEAGTSNLPKDATAELIATLRSIARNGKNVSDKAEKSVQLDSDDPGYSGTGFRDDANMKAVRGTGVKSTSAKELENSPRAQGGRTRDAK